MLDTVTAVNPLLDEQKTDGDSQNYREVPYNTEAEQTVLGAILTNNEAYHRVSEILRPEHFYMPIHGTIYEAITNMLEKGLTANPVTLKSRFDQEEG